MADAGGSHLNISAQVEKRGRGHPRGSKNKSKDPAAVASSSMPVKRRPGRPVGSKNKPKVSVVAPSVLLLLLLHLKFIPSSVSPALNAARFSGCR
jgi:hypothetical protein